MSRRGGTRRDSNRGAAETLGFILLLGLTVTGATLVVYFGGGLIEGIQADTEEESAEHTIREFDSRLSEVALSDNLEHTLDIDASDNQEVWVADDAEMIIQLYEDEGDTCEFVLPMGSLHYETEDRSVVTYQGGGIWKDTGDGNVMVSSPDMEYRDGTVTFPSVNINGTVDGDVDTLRASKDTEFSRQMSQEYTETMQECPDNEKMTITVESRYADVWGEYFEREVSENVTYDLETSDPDERSSTVTLETDFDADVDDDDSGVIIGEGTNTTVDVTVLGTEVSSQYDGAPVCVDWGWGCDEWMSTMHKRWAPVSVDVLVNGESRDPWRENLNKWDTQLREWTDSFEVGSDTGETTITMSSTLWGCDEYVQKGYDEYEGERWYHHDCESLDDSTVRVDATAGDNPSNVRVLTDGDEMPVLETDYRQRNAEEVLGPLLDESGALDLEENQMVFLFEITESDADWEDADEGIGDPNFNDVIALLEIEEQEGKEAVDNFEIRLTTTQVVIEAAE